MAQASAFDQCGQERTQRMKRAFVTGISGLLGANLAIDLVQSGYHVRGLVRDRSKLKVASHQNMEIIEGGLDSDLSDALRGVDILIHVAAETRQNLFRYSDYLKVNYEATVNLFNEAVRMGVKKFVFVSTANTMGFGSLDDPGNEDKEARFPFKASFYAKSKLEAENYVLKHKDKIETLVVNPTFMLGPHDSKPSSGKIILMGWKKRFVLCPPGGKNFVHVKDVSSGIIKAISKGRNGEKYLLANENLSYVEFFKKLNRIANQDPILIRIPKPMLMVGGYVGDLLRMLRIRTSLSSTNMKILCVNNFYSNAKSKTELELEYRPVELSIRDALDYFQGSGLGSDENLRKPL